MKIISFATVLLCLILNTGWTTEPDLSKRVLPSLSLKEAIDIAEKYLKVQKISKEGKFLARVDYRDVGSGTEPNKTTHTSGPYWQVTFEPDTHSQGGQIFIFVYMDRSTWHVGGM